LRNLKALKLETADPATWLYPLVESCLPEDVLLTWSRRSSSEAATHQDGTTKTRLDLMMDFLGNEVEALKKAGRAKRGFPRF